MNLNLFRNRIDFELMNEADELEIRFGHDGAVRHLRDRIARSDRDTRQHLYRLHDEIVRRTTAEIY